MLDVYARHGGMHVETVENALAQMMGMLGDPHGAKPIVIGLKPRQKGEDTA
jgi:hypothetical protein